MDRRAHLKTLILGTVGGGLGLAGCKTDGDTTLDGPLAGGGEENAILAEADNFYGRTPAERKRDEALHEETFLTEHELATVTVLANTILPPSEHGGIEEAEVPEFVEFICKDVPRFQLPLRGGLMWLDREAGERFDKAYKELGAAEQKEILDPIAFYDPNVSDRERPMPIQFFSLMRGLTMTGYYTSAVGIKDLGYQGNAPNIWDGVPQHVLDKHGVAYDPAWIAKCIDQSTREEFATWDEAGNLLT